MSEGSGRAEMERSIVQRSLQDENFRQRLLDDPKAAVEEELGTRLPEGVEVRAVEETAQTIYLVLPVPRRSEKAKSSQTRSLRRWPVAGRRRRVIGQAHARAVAEDLMRSRPP